MAYAHGGTWAAAQPLQRLNTAVAHEARIQVGEEGEAACGGASTDGQTRLVARERRDRRMLQRVVSSHAPTEKADPPLAWYFPFSPALPIPIP
jgi:hypothetical protein